MTPADLDRTTAARIANLEPDPGSAFLRDWAAEETSPEITCPWCEQPGALRWCSHRDACPDVCRECHALIETCSDGFRERFRELFARRYAS